MQTLHELQTQFINGIDNDTKEIFPHIRTNNTLSSQQHLSIYQNSIIGALQKILKEIYPVCLKLVGEEFFIAMINEYIPAHYSSSPDLGDYGTTFPDFIENFPPVKALPYLAGVAQLELAYHQLFGAKDAGVLDLDALASVYETQGEKIIFYMPPKSSLIDSPYPIHQIWESNQDNYEEEQTITLGENKHYYFLIWRDDAVIRFDLLSQHEWLVLSWFKQQWELGKIVEEIEKQSLGINFSELLPKLVVNKWIAGFNMTSAPEISC